MNNSLFLRQDRHSTISYLHFKVEHVWLAYESEAFILYRLNGEVNSLVLLTTPAKSSPSEVKKMGKFFIQCFWSYFSLSDVSLTHCISSKIMFWWKNKWNYYKGFMKLCSIYLWYKRLFMEQIKWVSKNMITSKSV